VIDPVTRVGGHLRVEATLNEQGEVTEALSSGTMWRGIEIILQGRDPRDAWAFCERICGICSSTNALASVRAVENALGVRVPANAEIIRNIMNLTQLVHNHVLRFYHLQSPDWVDVAAALAADPAETVRVARSISPARTHSEGHYRDVLGSLKTFIDSGQMGLFQNGYWGHPAYTLPPELDLIVVADYLEALRWQKDLVKIQTIFGGKHPHPNYLVGGMACAFAAEGSTGLSLDRLEQVRTLIDDAARMVEEMYVPDVLAVASHYPEWARQGGGPGNFLVYGDLPLTHFGDSESYRFRSGVILGHNLREVLPVDLAADDQVREEISHSWYRYPADIESLHPWSGRTDPDYDGPEPPYEHLDVDRGYSWLKAPRWRGHAMEVGPLARLLVGMAQDRDDVQESVNEALGRLKLPESSLYSTLGRMVARGLECRLAVHWLRQEFDRLMSNLSAGDVSMANTDLWEPSTWPAECTGLGHTEAPGGALGHWVRIKDQLIENYQCVVPSTWNASPRGARGQPGPYEAALVGTPTVDPDQPVEILRTVHSFDPCLACASHTIRLPRTAARDDGVVR